MVSPGTAELSEVRGHHSCVTRVVLAYVQHYTITKMSFSCVSPALSDHLTGQ